MLMFLMVAPPRTTVLPWKTRLMLQFPHPVATSKEVLALQSDGSRDEDVPHIFVSLEGVHLG